MKKRYGLLCALCIGLAVCVYGVWTKSEETDEVGHHYIAHAGGALNGQLYTNSLEAVDHAIRHGFKYIELDLQLTTDNRLVFLHDWRRFKQNALGIEGDADALSYSEYQSLADSLYHRCGYHVITVGQVDSILDVHRDVYLVLDRISKPDIVEKYFSRYRHRLLVECLSYEDYDSLKVLGYYKTMLSGSLMKRAYWKQSWQVLKTRRTWSFPEMYVVDVARYAKLRFCCNFFVNAEFALFSCKDRTQADSLFALYPHVRYIYVDNME